MFKIKKYEEHYRDDIIFVILSAKDALGTFPSLNHDLLDIEASYLKKGDMFWVAVDETDRVAGAIGTNIISISDMWLKRLYVKPSLKRNGIGSMLLTEAENFAKLRNIETVHTRFNIHYTEAAKFYPSKGFVERARENGLIHMVKSI